MQSNELSKITTLTLTDADKAGVATLSDRIDEFETALQGVSDSIDNLKAALRHVMDLPVMLKLMEIEKRHLASMLLVDDHKRILAEHISKLKHAFPFL